MNNLKYYLDENFEKFNSEYGLKINKDPIYIAKKYNDEFVALIAALFAYGKVENILSFLNSLSFDILKEPCFDIIYQSLEGKYYRFQTREDIAYFFYSLAKIKKQESLLDIFLKYYLPEYNIFKGINGLLEVIKQNIGNYNSQGLTFLLSKPINLNKIHLNSPHKRWFMFLRWMVRKDFIDLGLWQNNVRKRDLIIPLDTHTYKVSLALGLTKRKSYDLKSAILITEKLREFDKDDPVKYDFALYRIGQNKIKFP